MITLTHHELFACSAGGNKFSPSTIFIAFKALIQRFESGELRLPKCVDIVTALLRDNTGYRGGTLSVEAKKVTDDRKKEYSKMIVDCRAELKSAEVKKKKTIIHKVSYMPSVYVYVNHVCVSVLPGSGKKKAQENRLGQSNCLDTR